eukprot:m.613896 g.613896  ORF g.613896 m.613896 type:complete len:583 (-) comp22504_c0_seq13:6690-8438(-)
MRLLLDDHTIASNDVGIVSRHDSEDGRAAFQPDLDVYVWDSDAVVNIWREKLDTTMHFVDVTAKDVEPRTENSAGAGAPENLGIVVRTPETLYLGATQLVQVNRDRIPEYNSVFSIKSGLLQYLRKDIDFVALHEEIPVVVRGKSIASFRYQSRFSTWDYENTALVNRMIQELLDDFVKFEACCTELAARLQSEAQQWRDSAQRLGRAYLRCAVPSGAAKDLTVASDRLPVVRATGKTALKGTVPPLAAVSHINSRPLSPEDTLKSSRDEHPTGAYWTIHTHRRQALQFTLATGASKNNRSHANGVENQAIGCSVRSVEGFVRVIEVLPTGLVANADLEIGDILNHVYAASPGDSAPNAIPLTVTNKQSMLETMKLFYRATNGPVVLYMHSNRFEVVITPETLRNEASAQVGRLRSGSIESGTAIDVACPHGRSIESQRRGSSNIPESSNIDDIRVDGGGDGGETHVPSEAVDSEDTRVRRSHGFALEMTKDRIYRVARVDPGMPAAAARLLVGDWISHIDGYSLRGCSLGDVQKLLHTTRPVSLSVSRLSGEHPPGYTHSPRPHPVRMRARRWRLWITDAE